MKMFLNKGRFLFWLVKAFVNKHSRVVVSGFLIGIFFSFLGIKFWPRISFLIFPKRRITGIIGVYSPTNPPLLIQNLLSSGLTTLSEQGEAKPGVAYSWEATDSGKLYIFNLKENLRWHDGKKFKASHINYSLKDVEIKPIDDYTLEIRLKEPFSPLPTLLAKPVFRKGFIGLGPYKLSALKLKGDQIESITLSPLEKRAPSLEYKFYPTEAAAITAFKLGEIDILEGVSDSREFESWKNVEIKEHVNYHQVLVVFYNTKNRFLSEKKIRQALSYAIPELGQVKAKSPISPTSWAYYDKVKDYNFELEKVHELFEEVGIASYSAQITLSTFFPYLDVAQKITNSWEKLGIKVTVKVENSLPSSFDAFLTLRELPPDPDQYPFWHSTQETNITKISSPKIDKLLEDGRKTTERKERLEIYYDFQRYLVEEAPASFLYFPKVYTITRK